MAKKKRKSTATQTQTEHIQFVTSGSNIRLEPAHSSRGNKQDRQRIVVSVGQDISPVGNFLGFLREHAVVGLIIGFVIGNQVQSLVKQLIQSFLDPLTKLLFGTALSQRTFTLHFHNRDASFSWGAMVYALIIFLFVVIVMYIAIRLLKLDKLEEKDKESN
jgi:large-conductance mechanosensitive channel